MVDPVVDAAADTDHPAVPDRDVEPAAVAAQQAGRRRPGVDVGLGHAVDEVQVDPGRPRLAGSVRRPVAPDVVDPVGRTVGVRGAVNAFPDYEAYATVDGGPSITLFQHAHNVDPMFGLPGGADQAISVSVGV